MKLSHHTINNYNDFGFNATFHKPSTTDKIPFKIKDIEFELSTKEVLDLAYEIAPYIFAEIIEEELYDIYKNSDNIQFDFNELINSDTYKNWIIQDGENMLHDLLTEEEVSIHKEYYASGIIRDYQEDKRKGERV